MINSNAFVEGKPAAIIADTDTTVSTVCPHFVNHCQPNLALVPYCD